MARKRRKQSQGWSRYARAGMPAEVRGEQGLRKRIAERLALITRHGRTITFSDGLGMGGILEWFDGAISHMLLNRDIGLSEGQMDSMSKGMTKCVDEFKVYHEYLVHKISGELLVDHPMRENQDFVRGVMETLVRLRGWRDHPNVESAVAEGLEMVDEMIEFELKRRAEKAEREVFEI